jgi:hypothetical protein
VTKNPPRPYTYTHQRPPLCPFPKTHACTHAHVRTRARARTPHAQAAVRRASTQTGTIACRRRNSVMLCVCVCVWVCGCVGVWVCVGVCVLRERKGAWGGVGGHSAWPPRRVGLTNRSEGEGVCQATQGRWLDGALPIAEHSAWERVHPDKPQQGRGLRQTALAHTAGLILL